MAETGDTRCRPVVVGVNHKTASLSLRDRLFVEDQELPKILNKLKAAGLEQAVFLSTCDRIEVHAAVEDIASAVHRIQSIMAQTASLPLTELDGKLYALSGEEAVRQMFAVAGSLDSLVIGESQVLGQVKAALKISRNHSMIGPELDGWYQAAIHTAKLIREKTKIGEGPVSLSAAAGQIALDIFGDLSRVRGLLIGSGDMAEIIARDMKNSGLADLAVMHPRSGRALMIAKALDCHVTDFDNLSDALISADVIICSMGRREHVLTADRILPALKKRRYKPLYILDIAIPGDVEPAVNRIDEAFLYDLNELEQIAVKGIASRSGEAERAWAILESELAKLSRGQAERSAVPVINDLRQSFEAVREGALQEAQGDAEKATRLLVNRLLHKPTSTMKGLAGETGSTPCSSAEWTLTEQILRRLFGLHDRKNSSDEAPDDD